jgi:hypothetical protein
LQYNDIFLIYLSYLQATDAAAAATDAAAAATDSAAAATEAAPAN